MNRLLPLFACAGAALALHAARPIPNKALQHRLKDQSTEVFGIVHWGLNTYTDREWGYGDEDPARLDPKSFDADQIVKACKEGGLGGLVIVAKHHDGFCLWPSKTTAHNISKSPFRGGKGDYVKEMEQACRRHGLKFGVYISPWDRNNAKYGSPEYVTEVFQGQIRELLGGDYGEVFEMWFDGANGGDGYYGGARERRNIPDGYYRYQGETFELVRKLQPLVCIFGDGGEFRWPGNERGVLEGDSRATMASVSPDSIHLVRKYLNSGTPDGNLFMVAEADFPMRQGWFYHKGQDGRTRCGEYLMQLYLSSVGNGGVMDIGIAPNKDGLLSEEDVASLKRFGFLRKAFFEQPVKPGSGKPFNVVVMREKLSKGEQIDGWEFLADGKPILSGKSIGIKRIRVLGEPIVAKTCEIRVTADGGDLRGADFRCYYVDPKLLNRVMNATTTNGETDTAIWMQAGKEGGR